jgi:hypothetical protein
LLAGYEQLTTVVVVEFWQFGSTSAVLLGNLAKIRCRRLAKVPPSCQGLASLGNIFWRGPVNPFALVDGPTNRTLTSLDGARDPTTPCPNGSAHHDQISRRLLFMLGLVVVCCLWGDMN